MERLTTNKNECNREMICRFEDCDICEEYCPHMNEDNCSCLQAVLEKLGEYEDAEEQGLLLKLPCKEVYSSSGDIVHYIFDYEIVECINCGVSMDFEGKLWITLACDENIFPYRNPDPEHDLDPTDWCMDTTNVSIDEWGKTVFLTKEEAEKALAEMKNIEEAKDKLAEEVERIGYLGKAEAKRMIEQALAVKKGGSNEKTIN